MRMQTPKVQSSPTAAGAELCLHAQVFGPAPAMGGTKAVARRRVIGACAELEVGRGLRVDVPGSDRLKLQRRRGTP